VIAGARIVPELIQGAFTPDAVASALAALLDDPARAAATRAEWTALRARLCGDGAFDRAAAAVLAAAPVAPGGGADAQASPRTSARAGERNPRAVIS